MSEQAASYSVTFKNKQAFKRAIKSEVVRLGKSYGTDYTAPEPSLIKALFTYCGWSLVYGSRILRVDVSTLRRWTADREQKQSREIPYAAWMHLLLVSGLVTVDALSVHTP